MATVKIYFGRPAKTLIRYVCEQTGPGEPLDGENCTPDRETLVDQFKSVRELHNFKSGNEAAHVIQAWSPEESKRLTPEIVNEMGRELARRYFPGHQAIVATHTNRPHLHNHIIVSTVNLETGKRVHNEFKHLHELRRINDEISRERGLSVPNRDARDREVRMPDKVARMVRHHRFSFIVDTQQKADFARAYATSYDEYVATLGEFGIFARVEPKNITYFYPGQERGKRGKNLGRRYDKPSLEQVFQDNDERFAKHPELRHAVRGKIDALRASPTDTDRLGGELMAATGGASMVLLKKDYSKFTHVPRREAKSATIPPANVANSMVPIEEIARARRSNIIDYCRMKGIPAKQHPDGTWRLSGREHVVLSPFEWTNTQNNTKGSLIDLVAAHKNMTYLQSIAHINNNPRLLLLEQQFGETKRKYTSFFIPRPDRAGRTEALGKLTNLLSTMNVSHDHAERLLASQQVQVSKGGVIRLFGKDSDDGALEFSQDDAGRWTKKSRGKAHSPFAARKGGGKTATIYTDPFTYMQKEGKDSMSGRRRHDPTLALLAPDVDVVGRFLKDNTHVDRISLVSQTPKQPSPVELDFFNNLKTHLHGFGINVEMIGLDRVGRGHGHGISF